METKFVLVAFVISLILLVLAAKIGVLYLVGAIAIVLLVVVYTIRGMRSIPPY